MYGNTLGENHKSKYMKLIGKKIGASALVTMASSSSVLAHPDHKDGFGSILHWVSEPDHLALVIGATFAAWFVLRRPKSRTESQHDKAQK